MAALGLICVDWEHVLSLQQIRAPPVDETGDAKLLETAVVLIDENT